MDLSIASLRSAYRGGQVHPRDVIDYVVQQVEHCDDPAIWIARLDHVQLARYVKRLQRARPEELPLYGVPFAIKDNIDLARVPTTAACPAFSYMPTRSAFAVQRLIEAGAIPIGKTNLDQFATGLTGTRSPYGIVHNSFDPEFIAGGSSSGSAAAVARGLVSFALGTDTAGSGRVPAALNNLIGVKPTRGVVSNRGVVPACWSLDCVSLLTLNPDDAALLLELVAQRDTADPRTRAGLLAPARRFDHYRIGVPAPDHLQFFGDEAYRRCFDAVLERCRALGEVRVIDFTPFRRAAVLLYDGPWLAERYAALEDFMERHGDGMHPVVRRIIGQGRKYDAADTFRAFRELASRKAAADRAFAEVDFILTPTVGTVYRIKEIEANPIKLNADLGYYTNFMNLLDYAALAVPSGLSASGLPFGVTFFGPAGTDRDLLGLAHRFLRGHRYTMGATGIAWVPAEEVSCPAQ